MIRSVGSNPTASSILGLSYSGITLSSNLSDVGSIPTGPAKTIGSRNCLSRKPSSVFDGTFGRGRDMAFIR